MTVLIITNRGYWLLMVKIEFSDKLKLIKYQMKTFQEYDDDGVLYRSLGGQVHSFKKPRI